MRRFVTAAGNSQVKKDKNSKGILRSFLTSPPPAAEKTWATGLCSKVSWEIRENRWGPHLVSLR